MSEYLRSQNIYSKLREAKKKKVIMSGRSPNFDSNSVTKQKKGQNDNGVVFGLDSAHP